MAPSRAQDQSIERRTVSKPDSFPTKSNGPESADPTWSTVRFRDCIVDRGSREVRRGGLIESLEPRAFDLLVFLITQRHQVVAKADILRHCWGDETVSDGALARTVMKIRRALGDADPDLPLIKTVQRVGYRFAGHATFSDAMADSSVEANPARSSSIAQAQRVALLPFENATRDDDLVWIELGLASVVAKELANRGGLNVVPVRDLLLALGELGTGAPRDERLRAVESALGVRQIVWGELSGEHGRYLLHFGLRMPSGGVELGSLVGSDVVRLAVQAAVRIRQWLTPQAAATVSELDLGDGFLNEMFARAMQKIRINRLVEADHLLDALGVAEVVHPELMFESAAVQVRLGRRNATAAVEALEQTAQQHASPTLQARGLSLRALHLDQQGRTAEAIAATRKAIELSDACGLEDLAVHAIVDCALRMGQNLDPGAEAMLSQAMPRAERLGSRVLLSKAYWTAGRLAGLRDDWTGAIRHHERALAIARTMDEAAWAAPLTGLARSQLQLGQLEQAHAHARAAFDSALISREQPQLGLSAICLLGTSWVTWRVRELVNLF
ncbi:MAG TPA: winged helix-turn-helix domain-containing protein, partial [Burkholderiaceae bacterium]|nr:winged helix-turn-helix domain-containing protein [Burkholderiaceae bacterium]